MFTHIAPLISQFATISLANGLDGFTYEDCAQYLTTPTQFNFSLKKAKGSGILYGQKHCLLRRSLFNQLTREQRVDLMHSKLAAANLTDDVTQFSHAATLVDTHDIGMGHSVYTLTFDNQKRLVIKQEPLSNQSYFTQLLTYLGWPSYRSVHCHRGDTGYELSDWLGDTSLSMLSGTQIHPIVHQLAKHAALGDRLGRGDRHLDNYMVTNGTLYPVDISYLFFPNNDHWLSTYINANISEINLIWASNPHFMHDTLDDYFDTYFRTIEWLNDKFEGIRAMTSIPIQDEFLAEPLDRLDHATRREWLMSHYPEVRRRLRLKAVFLQLIERIPDIIQAHPLLNMYALADAQAPSAFFMSETQADVSTEIKRLAEKHLGIRAIYWI